VAVHYRKHIAADLRADRWNALEQCHILLETGMFVDVLINDLLQLVKLLDQKLDAVGKGLLYPIRCIGRICLLLPVTLALQILGNGRATCQQRLQYPRFWSWWQPRFGFE